ncbi:MAG TPA: hypothetical protein VJ787_06940 [Thermoleophilia bacterium]|nr:hypothetical protein [Thermoleophilia bacterium]
MEWRRITASEIALVNLLLSANFSESKAIAEQVRNARVRTVDANGSIAFTVASSERAVVKHRVPIEAEADDRDGTVVHMLLHVVDGQVSELEFFKEDSSAILDLPPPDRWRLVELHG